MVNYSKIIADTASNHYNVRDEYKDNTYEQERCHPKGLLRHDLDSRSFGRGEGTWDYRLGEFS
jgi:hypothetical protein